MTKARKRKPKLPESFPIDPAKAEALQRRVMVWRMMHDLFDGWNGLAKVIGLDKEIKGKKEQRLAIFRVLLQDLAEVGDVKWNVTQTVSNEVEVSE